MGSEATPEMLAMARKVAGEWLRSQGYVTNAKMVLAGQSDGHSAVQVALSAIKETTERAAKLADQLWVGTSDGPELVSAFNTATALRNGEHYHDR